MRNDQSWQRALCSQLLLCEESRRKITTSTRLPTPKQVHEKEQKRIPINSPSNRQTSRMHPVYEIRHNMGIQQYQNQGRRQTEGGIPHAPRPVRTFGNVLRPHKLPSYLPSNDERNLPNRGSLRMAIGIHGRHCHPHKTTQ